MALEDVQDPNITRQQSSEQVRPNVQTATMPQNKPYVDPLLQTILENASKVTQVELNKELAKDSMRGYLMAQEGASIDEVRKNSPFVEKIFGEGATVRGAQTFIMQDSMDKYNLDIIENMHEYKKMSPSAFRETQIEQFGDYLTGDPDTDAQMGLMQADMFRKATELHTAENMKYEQEINSAAWYKSGQTRAKLFSAEYAAATTDEKRAQLVAELHDVLAKPEVMHDDAYAENISKLAIEDLGTGSDVVHQYIKDNKIPMSPTQLGDIAGAYSDYYAVKQQERAEELGYDVYQIKDNRRNGARDEQTALEIMALHDKYGPEMFELNRKEITSIYMISEREQTQGDASAMRKKSWILRKDMSGEGSGTVDKEASDWIAYAYQGGLSEEEGIEWRSKVVAAISHHDLPVSKIGRLTNSALANPTRGDELNPDLLTAYQVYSDLKNFGDSPGLISKQYTPAQVAQLEAFDEVLQSSGEMQAVLFMQSIADNPVSEDFKSSPDYTKDRDSGWEQYKVGPIENIFGTGYSATAQDEFTLRTAYEGVYDVMYRALGDDKAAAKAAANYMEGDFYTDANHKLHRRPKQAILNNAKIPKGIEFADAVNEYLADNLPMGFNSTETHTLFSPDASTMYVTAVNEDGTIQTIARPTKEIGAHARTKRGERDVIENESEKRAQYKRQLKAAEAHYQAKYLQANPSATGAARLPDEQPSDNEKIRQYWADQEEQMGTLGSGSAIWAAFNDLLGGGTTFTDYEIRQKQEEFDRAKAGALEILELEERE